MSDQRISKVVEDICGTSDGFLQKDEAGESLGFKDSKISTLDGKYVGLYFTQGDMKDLTFTGYETRPCVTFTEKLKEVYAECKSQGECFEIITLIGNKSQLEIWKTYHPWAAILCHGPTRKKALEEKYGIYASPALIVFGPDGSLCSRNARGAVMDHGAKAFPWVGMEDESQAPPDKASSSMRWWRLFQIFLWLLFIVGGGTTYFHNKFTAQQKALGAPIVNIKSGHEEL